MTYRPVVNGHITIMNEEYVFTEHPFARRMPYGQTGRRATVYQIRNSRGDLHALKIFTKAFRNQQTEKNAERVSEYAKIPGLQVCSRTALVDENTTPLIDVYPELKYAVFMPWILGQTWQETMLQRQAIAADACHAKSLHLAATLKMMEQYHVAHCDLSAPNLLLTDSGISLVDIEDMFVPDLPKPQNVPAGSVGYGHKTADQGIWSEHADRFAGGILLAEMLCWCNPNVVRAAYGESYFSPADLQTENDRFQLMFETLSRYESSDLLEAFLQTWNSSSLEDCPSMSDWCSILESKELIPPSQYLSSLPRFNVQYESKEISAPKTHERLVGKPDMRDLSSRPVQTQQNGWLIIMGLMIVAALCVLSLAGFIFAIYVLNVLFGY